MTPSHPFIASAKLIVGITKSFFLTERYYTGYCRHNSCTDARRQSALYSSRSHGNIGGAGAPKASLPSRLPNQRAFTLLELLTVIAIVTGLVTVLLPVFAQARAKARQTACLSNLRQMGGALFQYLHDYDETFPNGLNQIPAPSREGANGAGDILPPADPPTLRIWAGSGWAGQCYPYLNTADVFSCPTDPSASAALPGETAVSYGYNINLVENSGSTIAPSGEPLAEFNAPSHTVALFEVTHVFVNLEEEYREVARQGGDALLSAPGNGSMPGRHFSSSSTGLDNRLYAQKGYWTSTENRYATGYLGGRHPFDSAVTQFTEPLGRHSNGSNYLLSDGHVRWLPGAQVSSGLNAMAPFCSQDNIPAHSACEIGGRFRAAGTASTGITATFSIH